MIPWCDINITYQFLPSRVFGLVPACRLKPPQKLGGVSAWFSLKQLINAEEKWTSKSQSRRIFSDVSNLRNLKIGLKVSWNFFFRDSKSHFVEVPGLLVSFWNLALGEGGDWVALARALRQARDHLAVFFDIGSECTSVTVSHRRCFDGFFCGLQNSWN